MLPRVCEMETASPTTRVAIPNYIITGSEVLDRYDCQFGTLSGHECLEYDPGLSIWTQDMMVICYCLVYGFN